MLITEPPGQGSIGKRLNSLPNSKTVDQFKLKAFADGKIVVAQKLTIGLESIDNIVGKVENASYQHFLLFPQCFQKATFSGSLIVIFVW